MRLATKAEADANPELKKRHEDAVKIAQDIVDEHVMKPMYRSGDGEVSQKDAQEIVARVLSALSIAIAVTGSMHLKTTGKALAEKTGALVEDMTDILNETRAQLEGKGDAGTEGSNSGNPWGL